MSSTNKLTLLNYILVLTALFVANVPFFLQFRLGAAIAFVFFGSIFYLRGFRLSGIVVKIVGVILGLILIQGLVWDFNLVTFFTFPLLTVITPFFLYRIVGQSIWRYLINIIYFFSVTSLLFWVLQIVSPEFDFFLQNAKEVVFTYSYDRWPRSVLFYTVAISKVDLNVVEIYRNSGIFHEPGGYALWLVLALGVNTIVTRRFVNRKNIIMVTALLSTFSTAAYIQLFVLLYFFVAKSRRPHLFIKVAVFFVFGLISYEIYFSASFMKPKVEQHIEDQIAVDLEGTYTTGRIIRVKKALNVIKQSPVFGRGIITASAEKNPYSEFHISGVSSVAIFARFGIIFGVMFFLYYYRGIMNVIHYHGYHSTFGMFFFLALFLGGLSQEFFLGPLSIQFLFWGFENNRLMFNSQPETEHVYKSN